MNHMPADMALSGRDGNNILAATISTAAVSAGGENFLVIFISSGVHMK